MREEGVSMTLIVVYYNLEKY